MSSTKLENETIPVKLRTRLLLSLIILSGILLRLPNLNESLWYDELFSTRNKLSGLRELAAFSLWDVHPPFYSVLMFLWTGLFGDSEISVRFPPLLFGILTIILIYELARRVADEKVALLAAFLLSFSPVHIWYSQEARSYSALVFFLLIVVVAQLKLNDAVVRPIWFFVYSVVVFLGVFSHFYLTVYLFLISIILILGNHAYKRRLLAVNAAAVFCLAVWLVIKLIVSTLRTEQADWRAFTFSEMNQLFFNWFLLGNSWDAEKYDWWIIAVQLIFTAIFLRGVMFLLEKSNRTERNSHEILLYLFIVPIFLLIISAFGRKNYIERSVITAMPFFYIVIAVGALALKNKVFRYACVSMIVFVSIATVAAYYSRQDVWTIYKPNADWRAAASYLGEEINNAPVVPEMFIVKPADELTYYNPRFKQIGNKELDFSLPEASVRDKFWLINRIKKQHTAKIHDKMLRDKTQRLYLIHNKYWSSGFEDVLSELEADTRFEYKSIQSFKGLDIYRFDLKQ